MAPDNHDSKRHGAFELGYNGRLLSGAHATKYGRGEPVEIDGLIFRLDRAALALLADDLAGYDFYRRWLHRAAGLYELQVELWAAGKTAAFELTDPEPVWCLLADHLDRLGVAIRGALRGDSRLEAWYAVGWGLADLTLCALDRHVDEGLPEPEWDDLMGALRMLTGWDRSAVMDQLPIDWASPGQLAALLRSAYESISAFAERDTTGGEQAGSPGDRPLAGRPRTVCQQDILEVLGSRGRRLTTSEMLTALERLRKEHGESTVKLALAEMARGGLLTNCTHCRPRGYGLPEWAHCH